MSNPASPKLLLALFVQKAKENLYDENDKLLASEGQNIVLIPRTMDRAVECEDGRSLRDVLGTFSTSDHTHVGYENSIASLQGTVAGYYENLVTLSERVSPLERDQIVVVREEFDPDRSE